MRPYELMMIHRPEMAEADVRKEIGTVEALLGDQGGEHKLSDFWGKRRFAYEIDHIHEGYYTVVTFDSTPEVVAFLDRALSLSDTVVRHKILKRAAA